MNFHIGLLTHKLIFFLRDLIIRATELIVNSIILHMESTFSRDDIMGDLPLLEHIRVKKFIVSFGIIILLLNLIIPDLILNNQGIPVLDFLNGGRPDINNDLLLESEDDTISSTGEESDASDSSN